MVKLLPSFVIPVVIMTFSAIFPDAMAITFFGKC